MFFEKQTRTAYMVHALVSGFADTQKGTIRLGVDKELNRKQVVDNLPALATCIRVREVSRNAKDHPFNVRRRHWHDRTESRRCIATARALAGNVFIYFSQLIRFDRGHIFASIRNEWDFDVFPSFSSSRCSDAHDGAPFSLSLLLNRLLILDFPECENKTHTQHVERLLVVASRLTCEPLEWPTVDK